MSMCHIKWHTSRRSNMEHDRKTLLSSRANWTVRLCLSSLFFPQRCDYLDVILSCLIFKLLCHDPSNQNVEKGMNFWLQCEHTALANILTTVNHQLYLKNITAGTHRAAFQSMCSNVVSCSLLRPGLSGIFTGSVLVIVFSFSGCPPVTTAFSQAAWAEPRCDSDFPNSAGVTVPGSPVPFQKQTWFCSPALLMGPLFSSPRSTGSGLYKFLFWGSFLFLVFSCDGTRREALHLRRRIQAVMDVMFPLEVFVYDSHYPFQCVSPRHSVLLRNGLVVLHRIDLYTFL